MLPVEFCERMKQMLGQDEYDAFLQSYDEPKYQGLRFNPLKGALADFMVRVADCMGKHISITLEEQ